MEKMFTKRCERYAGYGTLDGFKLLLGGGGGDYGGGEMGSYLFGWDGMDGWMVGWGGMGWDGMDGMGWNGLGGGVFVERWGGELGFGRWI